jgi:uncharacterized protein
MVPGHCIEAEAASVQRADDGRLLEIATLGVQHAAESRAVPVLDLGREPRALLRPGASFVTLKRDGRLRGCIGSLEPSRPLAEDVAQNAYAAARRDPRFPALEPWEIPGLDLSVATLGPHERVTVTARDELLAVLRPGIDGLVVRSGSLRATFLPAVWEQLPSPDAFIDALWQKARLVPGAWPANLELSRYHVTTVRTRL